ncbi:DUF4430 domain-containing protein [Eubacterium sp. LFL-14]|uniref:DUF4430 domain-containing protein n=1 Tax=Eubacterium album TaxID=2978477 RepID=A0ABT2M3C2_9FIRM|nr:DUF4430 domain-containing protein [Eubacterium sp. LFL-14]MCT7399980.1 DUF4430 domain-containing protein [Eubacterium sp. LFL-14]
MNKTNLRKLSICIITILMTFSLWGCGNSKSVKSEKATQKCTLYVTCINAINSDKLQDNIRKVQPKDGVIYETKEVKFTEGESCFDILERELKNAGILIESSITPATKSVYIEGINNLYEFDCGKQSGWMYTVNGDVPNVSCSEYKIKENDEIKFQYTCNLGEDIEKK